MTPGGFEPRGVSGSGDRGNGDDADHDDSGGGVRGRAAAARQAHNLEVAGSNPAPAICGDAASACTQALERGSPATLAMPAPESARQNRGCDRSAALASETARVGSERAGESHHEERPGGSPPARAIVIPREAGAPAGETVGGMLPLEPIDAASGGTSSPGPSGPTLARGHLIGRGSPPAAADSQPLSPSGCRLANGGSRDTGGGSMTASPGSTPPAGAHRAPFLSPRRDGGAPSADRVAHLEPGAAAPTGRAPAHSAGRDAEAHRPVCKRFGPGVPGRSASANQGAGVDSPLLTRTERDGDAAQAAPSGPTDRARFIDILASLARSNESIAASLRALAEGE